jgi:hypothetical protein
MVLNKKNLGNFGKMCFFIVSLTNFAILGANFNKILTSQIWKKKITDGRAHRKVGSD